MSVELGADLSLKLGDLSSQLDALCKLLGQRPIYRSLPVVAKTSAASAATWMFMDCGGPTAGRVWDVRMMSVSGDDPSAQVASTSVIAFKFTDLPPDGTTVPSNLWIINPGYQKVLPVTVVFDRDQCTLTFPWRLGLGIKGLGNNVNVHASIQVVGWEEGSLSAFTAP